MFKQYMKNKRSIQYVLYVGLSFWLLITQIASANREFSYKIIYASNSINHWETKNEVLGVHDALINRVDEEYYYEIISQGIKAFEIKKDSTAELVNHQVVITIGDGKGLVVEGTFDKQCKVEVKRKSLLLSLFGKGNDE